VNEGRRVADLERLSNIGFSLMYVLLSDVNIFSSLYFRSVGGPTRTNSTVRGAMTYDLMTLLPQNHIFYLPLTNEVLVIILFRVNRQNLQYY
jgi:hypothetical protein